jgi:membrane-bound lytic murein transglycosylase B
MPIAIGIIVIGLGVVLVAALIDKTTGGTAQAAPSAAGSATTASVPAVAGSWKADIQQAAAKWSIPIEILTGVMGMETDYGRNITTSSAGAVGGFQFIRSTAASYGYPYTNSPNAQQQAQQADSAAHYLSDLIHQHGGDWNAALFSYSGGGYGLSQVNAKAIQAPGSF